MTPTAFKQWLAAMKLAGLAKSDAAAARALGVSKNTVARWKQDGTDAPYVGLACAALLNRLEPYS
jgi:DNA-binding transcriptional regulator YiaG